MDMKELRELLYKNAEILNLKYLSICFSETD